MLRIYMYHKASACWVLQGYPYVLISPLHEYTTTISSFLAASRVDEGILLYGDDNQD